MNLCLGIPINSHGSFSSRNYYNKSWLLGRKLFHPPFLIVERSIRTFGSICAFITLFFTNFFIHHHVLSRIVLPSRCCGSFSHFSNFCQFFNFSPFSTSRSLRHVTLSANSFTSLLLRSLAASHLDTSPRIHPTQKFECHRQHDLMSAQARASADPVPHHSQDTHEEHPVDENDDVFGASCSNRTVFLNLSGCSSFAVSDPLSPMWTSLILFSSCCFSSSPDAAACRSATCSSFLGSTSTSPWTSLNSGSFPLFHSLCLGNSDFVCTHPCFFRRGSLDNRYDSLTTFIFVCFCHTSVRRQRCTTQTTSNATAGLDVSRQHAESSWLNLGNSFNYNPWQ